MHAATQYARRRRRPLVWSALYYDTRMGIERQEAGGVPQDNRAQADRLGKMMPIFTSSYLSVQRLFDLVPKDGCMLVFNGNHSSWLGRAQQKRKEGKNLRVAVVDPKGNQKYQNRRDLYVYWKGER